MESRYLTVSSPGSVVVPASFVRVPSEILFPVSMIFLMLFMSWILSIPCCSFLHDSFLAFSQAALYDLCSALYLLILESVGDLICFWYSLLTVFLCFLKLKTPPWIISVRNSSF